MKLHSWDQVELEQLSETTGRRVVNSDRMTTARLYLKKGAVVARHSHEHEQLTHVLEGKLLFHFDNQDITAAVGDVVEISSHEPHCVEALEDSLAMDVFQPVRDDWLRGDDSYLRNPSGS